MPTQTHARRIPNNPHPPLPLIKITTQICIFGSEAYKSNKHHSIPNAKPTDTSLAYSLSQYASADIPAMSTSTSQKSMPFPSKHADSQIETQRNTQKSPIYESTLYTGQGITDASASSAYFVGENSRAVS